MKLIEVLFNQILQQCGEFFQDFAEAFESWALPIACNLPNEPLGGVERNMTGQFPRYRSSIT